MINCSIPNNIDIINDLIDKRIKKLEKYFVIDKQRIHIVASPYLEEFGYVRTNTLPDTKFIEWVDNVSYPSSWALYLGLVKKERQFYFSNNDSVTVFEPNHIKSKANKMMKILEEKIAKEIFKPNKWRLYE